jgi:ketosteroid isomerase-like protein
MAAVFTDDGEVIPAMQPGFVSGRTEIEAYNASRLKASRYLDVVITTVHIGVSGDLAWETGTSRVTMQHGKSAPVTVTGRYLAVWKRDPEGRWRIRADLPIGDPAP